MLVNSATLRSSILALASSGWSSLLRYATLRILDAPLKLDRSLLLAPLRGNPMQNLAMRTSPFRDPSSLPATLIAARRPRQTVGNPPPRRDPRAASLHRRLYPS